MGHPVFLLLQSLLLRRRISIQTNWKILRRQRRLRTRSKRSRRLGFKEALGTGRRSHRDVAFRSLNQKQTKFRIPTVNLNKYCMWKSREGISRRKSEYDDACSLIGPVTICHLLSSVNENLIKGLRGFLVS